MKIKYIKIASIIEILLGLAVARNLDDVSICEKILSSAQKTNCLVEVAIVTRDASICKRIEPEFPIRIIHCYGDVARRKGDPSICDNIEEGNAREECYSIARS